MKRLINVIFLMYLIAVEARFKFPASFNKNDQVLFENTKAKISYQLPTTVKPVHYSITLTPYFHDIDKEKEFKFDGNVKISFEVTENVESITFHSRNLTFQSQNIVLEKDKQKIPFILKDENEEDQEKDFKVLIGKFDKGLYVLSIDYVGILGNDARGFYKSSYKNHNTNETVWLAATHFEPVGARRAFPCFDEPKYKATFNVTIIHPEKYTAISNARRISSDRVKESIKTSFETTPKMSTYLLAFIVSDFGKKDNGNGDFTVYARPNAIQHANLAVEIGEKLLKALAEYTNIKFEIPKMEQAAVPELAASAMENWGLVIYGEKSLLYDENEMSVRLKQRIVETIAHEFAHQWFGDLVSPKWWKYVWLNEGFANFFQSFITEKVLPEWRSVDQSVVKSIQIIAFETDSEQGTHPLNQDVESPKEIRAIFDDITYSKGGAVIRMMQHFLTESVFQKGLNTYLNSKNHDVADSDDLFKALQSVTTDKNVDVKKIMDSWVNFKGYPVVTVIRNYDKNELAQLKQERFITYDPDKEEQLNHTWHIPINYATEKKPDFNTTVADFWFSNPEMTTPIDVEPDQWLIINKQQTGFYRINYDEQNWNLIIKALNSDNYEQIHVLNRAQLVNDALAFVKQDKMNLKILLHLTAYLKNETDYVAWIPGFEAFHWLRSKLTNTEHYQILKEYVLNTSKLLLDSVGYDGSKDPNNENALLRKLSRFAAINLACSFGFEECTNQLKNYFEKWLNDSTKYPIQPDLKNEWYCHGLRTANLEVWNKTLQLCSTNQKEQMYLSRALACSNNGSILQYYLDYFAKDDSPISSNYTFFLIKTMSENSDIGLNLALDFVTKRFITLYRKIKNEDDITVLITSIGRRVTTQEQLDKLMATATNDIHTKFTSKAIKAAQNNINWLKNNDEILVSWTKELKDNGVSVASASISLIFSLLAVILTIIS